MLLDDFSSRLFARACGQCDCKLCPSIRIFGLYLAAHVGNNAITNGKPQPGALAYFFGGVKWFKNTGQMNRVNSTTAIFYFDTNAVTAII